MNNMDNAFTNKKDVVEPLVTTNYKKSSTIATQATTILALSEEVNKLQLMIINKRGKRW